jgi:hypothetical protein
MGVGDDHGHRGTLFHRYVGDGFIAPDRHRFSAALGWSLLAHKDRLAIRFGAGYRWTGSHINSPLSATFRFKTG